MVPLPELRRFRRLPLLLSQGLRLFGPFVKEESQSTSIKNNNSVPAGYRLYQNYPKPFNPETAIEYCLSKPSKVRLDICDLSGRRIITIVNRNLPAGTFTVNWDGRNEQGMQVSSGVYFYKIRAGEFSAVKKMVLLR